MAIFDEALICENLAKNSYFSAEAVSEIKQQIFSLENNIAESTAILKILSSETLLLEKELSLFMEEYCKEIIPLFRELNKMETLSGEMKNGQKSNSGSRQNQLSGYENFGEFSEGNFRGENKREKEKTNNFDGETLEFLSDSWSDIAEVEIKKIYKKLAKLCHPDLSPADPNSSARFAAINELYSKKDFASLILMEQIINNDTQNYNDIVHLEALEKKYDSVLNASDSLRLRKHRIISSSGYKLMQKARWQKMCGNNIITEIKNRLNHSIKIHQNSLGIDAPVL